MLAHQQTPRIYQDQEGTWFLTRYDDVKKLLSDPLFSRRPPQNNGFLNQKKKHSPLDELISQWILLNDPPHHTHLRQVMSGLFDPALIKDTQRIIEKTAQDLLNNMLQQDEVDFMQRFAYPLPVQIMNHLLGVNLDIETVRKWSISLATALDHGSPADFALITPDVLAMQAFFSDVLSNQQIEKRGWASKLIDFRNENKINDSELVATCIFLMIAAHETVQLTTGLGLIALLKHPKQLQLLLNDTTLLPFAIEEILRYDSPLNKVSRWTQAAVSFDELIIPANQLVVGLLRSANHDPEKFTIPNQFNILRQNNRHLAFGFGIHQCLGALLARLELKTAFNVLLPHLPRLSIIDDHTEWLENSSLRYLFKLMIKIK